jgi:CDP-diacylglycerol--serine O-phosphatidyltransferase
MKQIPNLFTLGNLFCGCMAIVFTLQSKWDVGGDSSHIQSASTFVLASFWLFVAAVIDFLDGFVARLMKATSELGAQLDSLSDVVSFGVAPSLIMYKLLQSSYLSQNGAMNVSLIMLIPAFFLALTAAWRLAVFNLDKSQAYSFRGVPTPITAMVVAAFPLILWYDDQLLNSWMMKPWFLYLVVVLLGVMMVSPFPMMSLKVKEKKVSAYLPQIILCISGVILLLFLNWSALPMIYVLYLALSLAFRKQLIKN